MSQDQQKVIDFIKHDRSLTGARNLYNKLPNRNLSFLASINRLSPTPTNIRKVIYQLCKAVGLQERQMNALLQSDVVVAKEEKKSPEKPVIAVLGSGDASLAARVMAFAAENAEWTDIQILAADIREETGLKSDGRSKEDLLQLITDAREHVISEEAEKISIPVKKSIKLREQFPFLKEKTCPDILKLLVNDLMNSYEKYKAGREKLWDSMTLEEEKILAREITDNFIENKQAFEELEYYKENGKLLGEHPVFEEMKIKEELEKLSAEELSKKAGALRKSISTNKKKAKETEDAEKKAEYQDKVTQYTWQEEFVKELLKTK